MIIVLSGIVFRLHELLPAWLLFTGLVVLFASSHVAAGRLSRRFETTLRDADHRLCPRCGYDLRSLPRIGQCPECGREYDIDLVRKSWKN